MGQDITESLSTQFLTDLGHSRVETGRFMRASGSTDMWPEKEHTPADPSNTKANGKMESSMGQDAIVTHTECTKENSHAEEEKGEVALGLVMGRDILGRFWMTNLTELECTLLRMELPIVVNSKRVRFVFFLLCFYVLFLRAIILSLHLSVTDWVNKNTPKGFMRGIIATIESMGMVCFPIEKVDPILVSGERIPLMEWEPEYGERLSPIMGHLKRICFMDLAYILPKMEGILLLFFLFEVDLILRNFILLQQIRR